MEEDFHSLYTIYENAKASNHSRRNGKRFNKKEARIRQRALKSKPHADDTSNDRRVDELIMREIATMPPEDDWPIAGDDGYAEDSVSSSKLKSSISSGKPEGNDFFEFLKKLKVPDDMINDDVSFWMSQMENLALLAYHMTVADSLVGITMAIFSYIKTVTRKSCIVEIGKMIDEMVQSTPVTAEEYQPHAWSGRQTLDAWNLFKSNTNFKRVSYLISAAMSLSVCTLKEIEWSPMGLKLISVSALEEQAKAVDVLDALLSTFVWCAETGWRVFETGSLKPLLYSDQATQKYNESVDWLFAHKDQALIGTLPDVGDYEKKVDEALKRTAELKAVQKTGATSVWLQAKYSELVDIKHKLVCKHKNAAMKFSPLGVAVTGTTGLGKSTLMKILMKCGLLGMGFKYDASRIITHTKGDEYDSTLTSDTIGMYFDDFGHGKPEHEKHSPVDQAIRILNNVACQAVKAELNQKGVVFINVKCYVVSSNHRDLNVRHYTDIPSAALRRFIMVRAKVRREFCKPGTDMLDPSHPAMNDVIPDVWELSIEECCPFTTKKGASYKWAYHSHNGCEIKDVGMDQFLDAYIALAKQHGDLQRQVLNSTKEFEQAEFCSACCKPDAYCQCTVASVDSSEVKPHMFENVNELVVDVTKKAVGSYVRSWISPITMWNSLLGFAPIKTMATRTLASELEYMMDDSITPFLISVTPDWVFGSNSFQRLVSFWQTSAAAKNRNCWLLYKFTSFLSAGSCSLMPLLLYRKYKADRDLVPVQYPFLIPWCALTCTSSLLALYGLHAQREARLKVIRANYLERRDALPEHWKALRANKAIQGAVAGATIIVGVKLLRMWNAQRIEAQADASKPGWFGYMMEKLGITAKTQTSTTSSVQIIESLKKSNLYYAEFKRSVTSSPKCNIFFPRKNVAAFPKHMLCDSDAKDNTIKYEEMEITVYRGDAPGDKFVFKMDKTSYVAHPTLDIVYAYVPNCPDLRDKSKFFPVTRPTGSCIAEFVGRHKGGYFSERLAVTSGNFGHWLNPGMYGFRYTTTNALEGACMTPLVSVSKEPCILGFHIGGKDTFGCCMTILKSDHDLLIENLQKLPNVLLSANATDIPDTIMGKTVISASEVHPHSMASKLNSDAYVHVLGSTKLRTQQRSIVQPSILSPIVEKVTGVPNKWGAPKLIPNWKGFNATLEHIVSPSDMFAPRELNRAKEDWIAPIRLVLPSYVKRDVFRPLTLRESILGVDGKQFLEAMNMSTSMGFPIFGKKSKWFDEVRENGVLKDRVPKEIVSNEVNRLLECWRNCERAYPVTSATLKDEPTPLDSEKVRVFQAGNVAMTMMMRMYFLPIIRFLCMHPTTSEMAVGMNAFGPDWEVLTKHWEKFGMEGAVGWDYSKYDVRMNSQITTSVYASLIELAELGGYPPDALHIMRNMVADIVHPLIDYNGTLLLCYNMNTSGNPLTVQVNNIGNSFYVRMGFFHVYPEALNFRSAVSAMFYGDDCIATIQKDYRDFNFVSYKAFMADHGIKITPPDKGGSEKPFLSPDECDFLKRKSNFIPEIGVRIGKLVEDSIFKSLHSNLASKAVTKEQVAISCLETAAHEWFAHGREVYDKRMQQMQQVCTEVKLPVPAVFTSFDDRVEHWKSKYSSELSLLCS